MYILHPRNISWQIHALHWPNIGIIFDFDALFSEYNWNPLKINLKIPGVTRVMNPNALGSVIHDVNLDIYMKKAPHNMKYLGHIENFKDVTIRGRSENRIETQIAIDDLSLFLILDVLYLLWIHSGTIPVVAIGRARVKNFKLQFQVAIRCEEEIIIDFWTLPWAQRKIQTYKTCDFLYQPLHPREYFGSFTLAPLSKKYLYEPLVSSVINHLDVPFPLLAGLD